MDGLKLKAVRETGARLKAGMDAGFEPRVIVRLIGEAVVALCESQIALAESQEEFAGEMVHKLNIIIAEVEKK